MGTLARHGQGGLARLGLVGRACSCRSWASWPGICLVLYFAGAVITVVRARWYSHVVFPLMYVAPVIASLALGFSAR